jgi:alpha-L-arabinofuranosidase
MMKMNFRLAAVACAVVMAMPADARRPLKKAAPKDSTRQVFIYCPGEREGLHIAQLDKGGQWRHLGQLCQSDYSQWGSQKRMFSPYVLRANDGSWRAVWGVGDKAPCFAAAYSDDLITWRPQDYPRMSAQGVRKPVIFKVKSDDAQHERFMIFYETADGSLRQTIAENDFRTFSPDKEAGEHAPDMIRKYSLLNDTVSIDGKRLSGEVFRLNPSELQKIVAHFERQKADAQLSRETMKDDARRYAGMKNVQATLTVDPKREKPISNQLIGVFFEDISYGADGGLYAEMVQNRDFEYSAADHQGWTATTAWESATPIDVQTEAPLSPHNPHYAVLSSQAISNTGWDGMALQAGENYEFSFFARCTDCKKKDFTVALTVGGLSVAQAKVHVQGTEWRRYSVMLKSSATHADARLVLTPLKKGSAAVDMISLFPEKTFCGRKNGLRADLAQAIADLHPKFVRFPGGCMSHGDGIGNIYHWSHTVGPLQDRRPARNLWNYHQTRGLGFFEYFQFCEDIGAEPLPVLAAGVPCQNSAPDENGYGGQQGGIPMEEMPDYINELLHLIEWANGDPATSEWARMRAEAGHPEPFHLKYIGIGNEDIISTAFEERYEMICKHIRHMYPDIKICGTAGPFHAPSADYVEGWRFARENAALQDLVDEHYYESTGWFLNHQDYYDHYPRTGPKVYLGEYASRTRTMESALAEAIYLCNIERNADVVLMTSYAPLLCNKKHQNWNPNMIYFDNQSLETTPSYETQRLFSLHGGDRYVASTLALKADAGTPETRLSQERKLSQRVAASVVRNSTTGKTCLKLVNALPVELSLSLKGITIPKGAKVEGFEGSPASEKAKCTSGTYADALKLPPYSFRVVEW